MTATTTHLWLREETKEHEHRVVLTPDACKKLLAERRTNADGHEEAVFRITVERSTQRIFDIHEYELAGCTIAAGGAWRDAPADAFILGLKELPENDTTPLKHRHVYFGHAYKNQAGWKDLLARFKRGGGQLLDLEFLNDEKGRRVAAFGYMAGFAGAAVGLDLWAHNQTNPGTPYPSIKPYENDEQLVSHLKKRIAQAVAGGANQPKAIVIGALGRCGTGACDLLVRAGIADANIIRWDMAETKNGGPFPQLLEYEILVNCIYLATPIPPFLTAETLLTPKSDKRHLSVVVDVSCDVTNPHNPLPFYSETTTFDAPVLAVAADRTSTPLDVVAIDHLPTLLPAESSTRFAQDLYATILQLAEVDTARVWTDVRKLFDTKSEGL
ncbi:saccharopine dehydrogenase [Capsaspora owczarzaki ATCC 30864]|uniref:Saccharopine dehydrogenase [NAD(+), L-lysine-forming] n=1 Tax=Capsaspora owczarzaki (strain ATCC 30864) TaxID=595528 RepID=A0A0D2WSX3_CAPO3|nr:saccharopine dehydrogenase [Capsaspora owczarzaki ATCC 30864]KJE95430.1 saccharopine dehydrogenase [Capsaspora owczarzaki ATCC 30864]|eukprot:XP_004345475.1 saccharopine dehydrogenase [Capsaspora owczarzaki ATCC 30864]